MLNNGFALLPHHCLSGLRIATDEGFYTARGSLANQKSYSSFHTRCKARVLLLEATAKGMGVILSLRGLPHQESNDPEGHQILAGGDRGTREPPVSSNKRHRPGRGGR